MPYQQFPVRTPTRTCLVNITQQVQAAVQKTGLREGACLVFCPHTTAGITINENADPDVLHDLDLGLHRVSPPDSAYRHSEGNSDAHLKSSLVDCSATVIVSEGRLVLGVWQAIYFAEFDGPRDRQVFVQALPG